MYCRNCGNPLYDDEQVCSKCGMGVAVSKKQKQIVRPGAATFEFIIDWLVLSLLFGILASVVNTIISTALESWGDSIIITIIGVLLTVVVNLGITLLMCKIVTGITFKKKTIKPEDINKVTKNIAIFFVVCTIFPLLTQFITLTSEIADINSTQDSFRILNSENYFMIKAVQSEKGNSFEEAKVEVVKQTIITWGIANGIVLVLNLLLLFIIVPFEKKMIKGQIPKELLTDIV